MSRDGMCLEASRAGVREQPPTDTRDVEAKLLSLLRGSFSDDFTLSISRTGRKWRVMQTNRASGKIVPEFGTGSSFQDAWQRAGSMYDDLPPR